MQQELKIYDINQLISILHINRKTALNYIHSGKIKAVKIGRKWTISEDNLRLFINGCIPA